MNAALRRFAAVALLGPGIALAEPQPVSPIPGAFRDLDFGIVLPGVPQDLSPSDPGAGLWVFRGAAGSQVTVTFTALPDQLTLSANRLALSFGPTSAAWNTVNNPATARQFDPLVGATATLGRPPSRLYVWLGGTARPAGSQAPGTYTATYTLDVSYAGP